VGLHVPVGRLYAPDMFDLARIAEVYGSGEIRLTVEQNVIIANVPDSRLAPLLKEPLLEKFSIDPSPLSRSLVSCTGSQFCNFALIETKNRAMAMIRELETELAITRPVRIHWTGCPNSCGQPQVADIGLMGTKTRRNGQTLEAVDIFMGGKVGKEAELGTCVMKAIPCIELKPVLRDLLIKDFGAVALHPEVADPAEAAPVAPSVAAPAATPAPTVNTTNGAVATITFAQSSKAIAWDGSSSLLEMAEQTGVDIPSSCRSGTCGTCKQKLLAGEVTYSEEPQALEDGDREAGYILTCIAHPAGTVSLEV
jgi:ferredoxin-nitrite reductase